MVESATNKPRLQRRTTLEELAMTSMTSTSTSTSTTKTAETPHGVSHTSHTLTLTEVPIGSDSNDYDDVFENSLGASLSSLLANNNTKENSNSSSPERHRPLQKLRAFTQKELDLAAYMTRREMSPFQERLNAVTILPNPLYCLYFILAGYWIIPALELGHDTIESMLMDDSSLSCFQAESPSSSAWSWSWFHLYHYLPSSPPPAIVAVWLGITLHAPFSFMYHFKYAHKLTDSTQRLAHWSRRLDHSGIHVCSAFLAYATTESNKYCFVNLLFNIDCIYRQFQTKVRPRHNQIRVFISVLAYTIPILNRGDLELFVQCWCVLFLGGYCFIAYPLGGWSHAVFHIILCFLPPLLMAAALDLPSSQPYLQMAAMCVNQGKINK